MPSIKWNGREVQNPGLRILVGTLAVLGALMGAVGVLLMVAFILLAWPIYLPTDYVLKRCGRRGFLRADREGVAFKFDIGAFRRL